ncbi:MAG: ATP-dependent RecD-like DNA helicase [Myxococcales bacterium]|nr:ATP-dependent RecD-like DNA helicase [Myxococcales bacterium]
MEWIEGTLERIKYSNDEGSWCVAQLREETSGETLFKRPTLVTVVGNLLGARPGEQLKLWGSWKRHPSFGLQFDVRTVKTDVPVSAKGIEIYLGSGLVQGIGPKLASRLVEKFGDKTLDVIDNEPERLSEVEGIGQVRIERIAAAWKRQGLVRDIMLFLQSHGVTPAYATKIYKTYGDDAIVRVQSNPYGLARDVYGMGFKLADRVAEHMGIKGNDPRRVRAGIQHVLMEAQSEGHLYLPMEALIERASAYLRVNRDHIVSALESLVQDEDVLHEPVTAEEDPRGEGHLAVYARSSWDAEMTCAQELKRLLEPELIQDRALEQDVIEELIDETEEELKLELAPQQRDAIAGAAQHRVLVITGGPGTGKTTIVQAICSICDEQEWSVNLSAPTGRAARRLTETTGRQAQTLHRLLEFSFQAGGFQRNRENPLAGDVIIVDEASMIDIHLMRALLRSVPSGSKLVLVGDVDQLPSVGPGNVLADLIRSGAVPVCRLTEVFRQAAMSAIVRNAHAINKGRYPDTQVPKDITSTDFFLVPARSPDDVLAKTLKIVTERVEAAFGFDPATDVQVISPMRRGVVGCERLNHELQSLLNPSEDAMIQRGQRVFKVGDRVMQIRNNYDKNVFNGDIGHVIDITAGADDEPGLIVEVDDNEIRYELDELDELQLAYAITAHKSQGSEYPVVVIALATAHYVMLERNLLYTALTRARRLAVIVTMEKALNRAVKNVSARVRYTRLAWRL